MLCARWFVFRTRANTDDNIRKPAVSVDNTTTTCVSATYSRSPVSRPLLFPRVTISFDRTFDGPTMLSAVNSPYCAVRDRDARAVSPLKWLIATD